MKVHVNHKDEVRKCRALIKCRYDSGKHFDNEAAAMAFVEEKSLQENLANTFVSLTRESSKQITESPGGMNLLRRESEATVMLKEEGKHNFQITGPNSTDFKKIEVLNYTFFQKKFTGKTGIPMEHTILANPKVYENPWPPHTNTLARGVITRTDKQIGRGLRNQHFLQYAVVEAKNLETKEKEIVIFINAIAVPEESKGKGLGTELIDEMTTQYPDLRVPESSMMSQQGKDFRIKLQASRGDKFRGVISEFLHLNPWGESFPSFEEPEDFDDDE